MAGQSMGRRRDTRRVFDCSSQVADAKNRIETAAIGRCYRGNWYIAEAITIFDIDEKQETITAENATRTKNQREFPGEVRYERYRNPKGMYVHEAKTISLMSEIVDHVLSRIT